MEHCINCGSSETLMLNETKNQHYRAVMSDGKLVNDFSASKHLCKHCGSIYISYSPPNRLEKYFAEEYNVSEEVQNCQVVISGKRHDKHSFIHDSVLNFCSEIPPKGHFLEIACGNGMLSSRFAKNNPDWECVAIDPSKDSGKLISENVRFIRQCFDPASFIEKKFDVIVAHGILNRTPTLKMLESITSIANKDARISLEIVTLENSIFAPYIWDHSYTFLEETFCEYLKFNGIIVQKRVDCGSTIQFLCKYVGGDYKEEITPQGRTIESTHKLFQNHLQRWEEIKSRFFVNLDLYKKKKIILFGAGLYSAILTSLVDNAHIDMIIDEVRTGSFINNLKIISLDNAVKSKAELPIFVCARANNINYIRNKLETRGFSVVVL